MWRYLARPILFRFDAEWVHYAAMNLFSASVWPGFAKSIMSSMCSVSDPRLVVEKFGIQYSNPVGLAAGFDKDARWIDQLSTLGFSHIEVGTLTGQAQSGNPKKRLFRLPKDQGLLNCLGFNNRGSLAASESLAQSKSKKRAVLGINIGLTKKVADEIKGSNSIQPAIDDYLTSFRRVEPYADYITINVSSPNTPGLRDLQHPKKLGELIAAIKTESSDSVPAGSERNETPIFVKLAPDLSETELDETLEAITNQNISGIIATNTTISDAGLKTEPSEIKSKRCQCPGSGGGFSGRPLTARSREFVASVFRKTEGKLPIIGVGGIMTGDDAWSMICAGASLLQVYTGFIYGGPMFVKGINTTLLQKIEQHGLNTISSAVGRDI